jgi:hypothetical protein
MEEIIINADHKIFWFILLAGLWSLPWKAIALWKSARQGSKPWFIALLVINTLGALEILYIFYFSKMEKKS